MFKGFINRLTEGDPNQADYSYADMPKNRWSLFWRVIREKYLGILTVSLIVDIFAFIPTLWALGNLLAVLSTPDLLAGQFNFFMLGMIIGCPMLALGFTGCAYVTRNWSRDRHAGAWSDFWYGIGQNWKQALVIGLLDGVLAYTLWFNGYTYAVSIGGTMGLTLAITSGMLFVFLMMINVILFPLMVSFDYKFGQLIKNALLLTVGRLPHALFFLVIAFLPFGVLLFLNLNAVVWVLGFYMLFGFGLVALMFNSYANSVFDKFINPHVRGAVTREGLRPLELDEYGEPIYEDDEYEEDEDDGEDEEDEYEDEDEE